MRILGVLLALITSPLFAAGWGTLTAAFEYDGKPPVLEPIKVNRDVEEAPPNDSLTIGPQNELANVVLYLVDRKDRAAPVHPKIAEAISETTTLTADQGRYQPKIVVVAPGRTLRFDNRNPYGLNPQIERFANLPDSRLLAAHGQFDYRMKSPERIPMLVSSTTHPWMRAYYVANSNPYVAVSDAAGRIKLEHVPAGEWEFVLWHGELVKRARIDGVDTELVRGRIKVTIEDGKTTDLGVVRFVARPL